jgi:putative glutamine amidotransferase
MEKKKIYVVGKGMDTNYADWMNGELVNNMEAADLVVFTGGADVSPYIYGDEHNPKTGNNPERDRYELKEFRAAVDQNKHIIGICRGSQFSCAASGGRLVQHQENPNFIHPIQTSSGSTVLITSTHHQAMYPYDMNPEEYKVLAWTEGVSPIHENGRGEEISPTPFKEVEICYFPKTKALGIQGHPEMMNKNKYPETFAYLENLLDSHLNDKL